MNDINPTTGLPMSGRGIDVGGTLTKISFIIKLKKYNIPKYP